MTALPEIGSAQVCGTFIIVQTASGFALGVKSVKPGGTILFSHVGSLLPLFATNDDPFSSVQASEGDLTCPIKSTCSPGSYPFDLAQEGASLPATLPYTIHVHEDGQASASYRVAVGNLRVALPVAGQAQQPLNIGFVKESFSAAVEIQLRCEGTPETKTIPANQMNGVWTLTPGSVPATFCFKVNAPTATPTSTAFISLTEVVGSDEGDLDIVPP